MIKGAMEWRAPGIDPRLKVYGVASRISTATARR